MNKIKSILLAAGGIVAMGATVIAVAAVSIPNGWYINGGSGYSKADTHYGPGVSVGSEGSRWNANAGYKFMPYFAFEGGYTRYANSTINVNTIQIAKNRHYSCDLAAKGLLPGWDTGFELYAKLGAAYINSIMKTSISGVVINPSTQSMIGLYVGGGVDYSFTPNFAMYAEWDRAKGSSLIGNLDLYSGGIAILFG